MNSLLTILSVLHHDSALALLRNPLRWRYKPERIELLLYAGERQCVVYTRWNRRQTSESLSLKLLLFLPGMAILGSATARFRDSLPKVEFPLITSCR